MQQRREGEEKEEEGQVQAQGGELLRMEGGATNGVAPAAVVVAGVAVVVGEARVPAAEVRRSSSRGHPPVSRPRPVPGGALAVATSTILPTRPRTRRPPPAVPPWPTSRSLRTTSSPRRRSGSTGRTPLPRRWAPSESSGRTAFPPAAA